MDTLASWFATLIYNLLYFFTLIREYLRNYMTHIYVSNSTIKYIIDDLCMSYKEINAMYVGYKLEPRGDWCAVFHDEKNVLYECYMGVHEIEDVQISDDKDDLLILKIEDKYLFRIINDKYSTPENLMYNSLDTDKYFITVDYTHPEMKETISIDIKPCMYRTSNEILSSTFILWYLEHQPLQYIFDDRYVLKIMDKDINYIELSSKQHVYLGESEYKVINM